MHIVEATTDHLDGWAALRIALWAWGTPAGHRAEAGKLYCTGNPDRAAFVAVVTPYEIIGFAEAALRRDWVEGCSTSPVAFLEGIYVAPAARKRGVARALATAVGNWGRSRGCSEYASNALLDNADSHAFHAAIGFAETERVVFFRKNL